MRARSFFNWKNGKEDKLLAMSQSHERYKELPEKPELVEVGKRYELRAARGAKSFYGKASVRVVNNRELGVHMILTSYDTDIATIDRYGHIEKIPAAYQHELVERTLSPTSTRHFREFQSQAMPLSEMLMEISENRYRAHSNVI